MTGVAALGLLLSGAELAAQGAVFGVARDSSGAPISDVDVLLQPAGKRARTDFAGRYAFEDVGNGAYTVFARKIGFAPESWEARISAKGRVEVNLTMRRRTDLDTIKVVGTCDGLGVTNFECRRKAAPSGSMLLDYPDIDAFGERYVADLFRHIPGFLVSNRMDNGHLFPVVQIASKPYKCLNVFVDGREPGMANQPPRFTKDLVGLELYLHTDSVPITNRRYMWLATANRAANPERVRRCGVLMYWTIWAPIVPPKASMAPKTEPKQFRGTTG